MLKENRGNRKRRHSAMVCDDVTNNHVSSTTGDALAELFNTAINETKQARSEDAQRPPTGVAPGISPLDYVISRSLMEECEPPYAAGNRRLKRVLCGETYIGVRDIIEIMVEKYFSERKNSSLVKEN